MRLDRTAITIAVAACLSAAGCLGRIAHNLPPSQRLLEPGPGVGGPGPGVIPPPSPMMSMGGATGGAGGVMGAGAYSLGPCGPGPCGPGGMVSGGGSSQIAFLGVEGGEVAWDTTGGGMFDSSPLVMPGRQNFPQGAIYRLKLTNIPDRPGVELYPTLEVAPVTPRTDAYLAHAPIPIQFTDEDLDQVLSGNFVTKVIYLPDPEFQELALAGVETLVSTRLDPGVDPIVEADRRGAIMAILRVGNLDLQLPGQDGGFFPGANGCVMHAQYEGQIIGPTGEGLPYDGQPYEGQIVEGQPYEGQTMEGQYGGEYGGDYGGEMAQGPPCYGGPGYCGPGIGGPGMGGPQGMPTGAFAPQVAPPGVVSGVNGPQWGMPFVGTPIGLPGPPHIPLGHQAGLVNHTMKNHTRVMMPPPVHKMKMTVKQRPGMDYPRPANHVDVSEVNRAPFRLFGGTVACCCQYLAHAFDKDKCADDCPPEECPQ